MGHGQHTHEWQRDPPALAGDVGCCHIVPSAGAACHNPLDTQRRPVFNSPGVKPLLSEQEGPEP